MRDVNGRHTAESVDDLVEWVESLSGGPAITRTAQATCRDASHGEDPATWFYVEADATEGVAKLRCLSGGHVRAVADSDQRWTYPQMWSCRGCNASIAEAVYGVHDSEDIASWLVVGVRCVNCGDVAGVTDIVLAEIPTDQLLASL
jgi:hypothetical protein